MLKKLSTTVAILASVALTISGTISNAAEPSEKDVNGVYVGVEVGAINVSTIAINIRNTNLVSLVNAFGGSVTGTTPTILAHGRLYSGVSINSIFSAEVGFLATDALKSTYSGRSGAGVAYTASDSYSLYQGDLAIVVNGPQDSSLGGFFAKAGMHYGKIDRTASVTVGARTVNLAENVSGVGPWASFGYDKGYNKNLDVKITYSYYSNIAGASGLTAYLINTGIVYKF